MDKLTKIERFRISEQSLDILNSLGRFGRKKGSFIRAAISEKIERDLPQILLEQKQKQNKSKCPF